MSLKSAQHRLNGKYPMLPYILFFNLIIGFQFGLAMEVDQIEVCQDEFDWELMNAVCGYYDPNSQSKAEDSFNAFINLTGNRPGVFIP